MLTSILRVLIQDLPDRHRSALAWFDDHAGQTVAWPGQLADGTLLATKAKGIYKPGWTKYALSIRQSLNGPYPDRVVQRRDDGSWTFEYFQEGLEASSFADNFTNRGLVECLNDVVPVGVFIQTSAKPQPRYRILGLALVSGYSAGYFSLEGADVVVVRDYLPLAGVNPGLTPQARADLVAESFDPSQIDDEREKTLRLINVRRGQAGFRKTLLTAYGNRCAITGYEAEAALEAAHIVPYRGLTTNHPSNGLLLRADIHTLFDLGLMTVDYNSRHLLIDGVLNSTKYQTLRDGLITFPLEARFHPSKEAIDQHREFALSKGSF